MDGDAQRDHSTPSKTNIRKSTWSWLTFIISLVSCSSSGVQCVDDNDPHYQSNVNIISNKQKQKQKQQADEPQKMPVLLGHTVLLSETMCCFLNSVLPTLARGLQWVLLYSTEKNGISLRTLYSKSCETPGPFLLVVGDESGAVFGGLLSASLKPTAALKYQGSSETFVFTNVCGSPTMFRPTGRNSYFVLCRKDALALGGGCGHCALYIDSDLLNGSSGECETFGNFCLASAQEFKLKAVELWGFERTSK